MKTTRIILVSIFISILLLPYQIGKIQAHDQSSDLNDSVPMDRPDLTNAKPLSLSSTAKSGAPVIGTQTGSCHFGITTMYGSTGYDFSVIGVDGYIDWSYKAKSSEVADNIQYYRVINLGDTYYTWFLQSLPSLLSTYPGSIWIIGNEPDSQVSYQDHISAEVYAERFWNMAKVIRANDPTAKIAFGTVIQPTPVRIHYLGLAINKLIALEGDQARALALIDIFSIHAFILNERPFTTPNCGDCWGAGVPVGYDPATWPAYQVIDGTQTYDINRFKSRVTAFRQWMKDIGQQSKPLWITEYGSLFPTRLNVSELDTASFMEQSFDFMLAPDSLLGKSDDNNRLVQKWVWYSLNDEILNFGGSLYNPLTKNLTLVGDRFIKYNPPVSSVPPTNPDVYIDASNLTVVPGPFTYYKITLKVSNNVSSDRLTGARVDLLLGNTVVGTVVTDLPRCAGKIPVSFHVKNLQAGQNYTFTARVSLNSKDETDIDPANNQVVFQPLTIPFLYNSMMPVVLR